MKTIQCTREQFVNAMLTLKAPHPALYPFLSVFAAVWDSCNKAKIAVNFADSATIKSERSPHNAGYEELIMQEGNPAAFQFKINLPHAADGFHETYFETDGVGHFEVRYCGDDLDHLFPLTTPSK